MADEAQEWSVRGRCCIDAMPRLFRGVSVTLLFLALPVSFVCGVGFLVSGTLRFFIPTFTVLSALVLPAVLLSPLRREGYGVAAVSGWLSRYSHMALIGVTAEELELLDNYEQAPIHRLRQKRTVRIGDLERVAEVYLATGAYFDE